MDAEGDPVEDAVGGEAGELLLHLFDDAEGVLLRPGGGGSGLGDCSWCGEAEDQSGSEKGQRPSSQIGTEDSWVHLV